VGPRVPSRVREVRDENVTELSTGASERPRGRRKREEKNRRNDKERRTKKDGRRTTNESTTNEERTTKNEERRSSTMNENEAEERRAKDGRGEQQKETALPRKANGWRYKIGIKHKPTVAAKEASTQKKKRRDWNSFGLDEVVLKNTNGIEEKEQARASALLRQAASRVCQQAGRTLTSPRTIGVPTTTWSTEQGGIKDKGRERRPVSESRARTCSENDSEAGFELAGCYLPPKGGIRAS
jgi:hypothetical protein